MKNTQVSKEYSFLLDKFSLTPPFISKEASITIQSISGISFWTPLNSSFHTDFKRPAYITKPHHPNKKWKDCICNNIETFKDLKEASKNLWIS